MKMAMLPLLHYYAAEELPRPTKKMYKSFLCLDGTLRLFSEKFLVLGICFVSVLFLVTHEIKMSPIFTEHDAAQLERNAKSSQNERKCLESLFFAAAAHILLVLIEINKTFV